MAKLYFRYGTVGSAKTLNLLAVAHNYRQQNKKILLLKPVIDDRFGANNITSRAGLTMTADHLLYSYSTFKYNGELLCDEPQQAKEKSTIIQITSQDPLSCLIVDEAQFLHKRIINQLHLISIYADIPVILYGLRTNFRGELFSGTKRILELADTIEEVKTTCYYCNKKATHNLKFVNNKPNITGPDIELGADEKYKPTCKYCYFEKTRTIDSLESF